MAGQTGLGGARRGLFERFFHWEAAGSIVLLAATVVAMVWANSPWAEDYARLIHTKLGISLGERSFRLSAQHWVNDALMAIFFFVVGLEIKRELVLGELSSVRKAALPVSAALGGMVVPAALYAAFNARGPGAAGWGIPMATDIAFALGILALFGRRAPLGLKVFLVALAIADDLGAVLVIAVFYTEEVRWLALGAAAVFLALLAAANRARVRRPMIYVLLILCVWVCVFISGVHATVAGILVAMIVPVRARIEPRRFLASARENLEKLDASALTTESMVGNSDQMLAIHEIHLAAADMRPPGLVLEHQLHRPQAFVILPLFALFNAGVSLEPGALGLPLDPILPGVVLGLVVGKPVGILLFSWLTVRSGLATLPEGVRWPQILGVGCLAGVGFTMSLFVSELAFRDAEQVAIAKLAILIASGVAAVLGAGLLHRALPHGDRTT